MEPTQRQRREIIEYMYDVGLTPRRVALRLIGPYSIPLAALERAERRTFSVRSVDMSMAGHSRTDEPVLLDSDLSVIDGMHRIATAIRDGKSEIAAYVRTTARKRLTCDDCGDLLLLWCDKPLSRCTHWKCPPCVERNQAEAKRRYRNSPRGKMVSGARYERLRRSGILREQDRRRRERYTRRQPYARQCANCPTEFMVDGVAVGWNRRYCDECLGAVWGATALRIRRLGSRRRGGRRAA